MQQQLQALKEALAANRKEQRGAVGALVLSACIASHPPRRGPEITLQVPRPPLIPLGQEEEVNVKSFSLPQAWGSPLQEALLVATWHLAVQQGLHRDCGGA